MKFPMIFALIGLALTACKKNNVQNTNLNIQNCGSMTIVDSLLLSDTDTLHGSRIPIGEYRVFYLGKKSNIINLTKNGIISYLTEENDHTKIMDWTEIDSSKMTIYVDTLTTFACQYACRKSKNDSVVVPVLLKSYAIVVQNDSDSTIHLGLFNNLHAIKQLKTPQGRWVNAEMPITYFCGTGARDVFLKGHEILVSKLVPGVGKQKVESRLRFDTSDGKYVYSNTFIDFVDSIPRNDLSIDDLKSWANNDNRNVLFLPNED